MSKKSGIFAGIDLGTNNSCIAIYKYEKTEVLAGADGSRITPSYVYIGENGEKHVGKSAKNYGHKKPERLFYEISSEVLKKLVAYVGEHIDGVVLTVPAFFSTEQKNKILEAAEMAGITVLQLICEPTAAAIAYGMEHSYINGEMLFVFDMGGGTFDITIIKILNSKDFEVIVLGGDSHLGGRDFDGVIIDWMLKKLEDKVGKNGLKKLMPRKKYKIMEMAKEAKEALSQAEDAVIQLSEVHSDASDVTLTRTEFEELSKGLVAKVKESKFSKTVNAEEIVALGATRLAAKLGKQSTRSDITELNYKDKISLKVGIEYADINGDSVIRKVFDSNTSYNQEQVINMKTMQDKECEITLYEGLYDELEKNTHIGGLKLMNLPPKKAEEYNVDVILTIDKNGILEVKTNDLNCAVKYKTQLIQRRNI
uniref:Uncharacterized protein n=1 Tax=Panagrolaimus davidi TaxID=227884 RepID=A0A914QQ63_9BILA